MKQCVVLIWISFVSLTWKSEIEVIEKPHISFSFDDGNPNAILNYNGDKWNQMILDHLNQHRVRAVWFVAAKAINNTKGKQLLSRWNAAGHTMANHTYSHLNYNDPNMSCTHLIKDILKCDSLINSYSNYQKIFRFPYLKTGNTITKRDSMRTYLKESGFKQGWVTIDASDWYINSRLIQRLKKNPKADIKGYKDYYINHILERAIYYNTLSKEINQREIKHTVLLHFNLTSALFLGDLIKRFKKEGWEIDNYNDAIKDPIYQLMPSAMPSEQSLIWLLTKQSGKYDHLLRYPGEDGKYEKEKMDKLGL